MKRINTMLCMLLSVTTSLVWLTGVNISGKEVQDEAQWKQQYQEKAG